MAGTKRRKGLPKVVFSRIRFVCGHHTDVEGSQTTWRTRLKWGSGYCDLCDRFVPVKSIGKIPDVEPR